MLNFLKRQFSEFVENRLINKHGILKLEAEFKEHIKEGHTALLRASPSKKQIIITWSLSKKNGIIKYKFIGKYISRFFSFKNIILSYLKNDTLVIILKVYTGEMMPNGLEIEEIRGYRLILFNNLCMLSQLTKEDLYLACTTDAKTGVPIPPTENYIYCGVDNDVIVGFDMLDEFNKKTI